MNRPFALLLTLSLAAGTRAQRDTLFWFAAPEQSIHNQNFDRPIVLRITAYDGPASVTIDQPAGGGMPAQTVAVAAGSTITVDLTPWIDAIEVKPPNTVVNHGLRIRSTAPVSLYYEVVSTQCQCSPEIYVPKGRNALGTGFRVPMQDIMNNNPAYSPTPFSSFDIVATEDNTSVTILPTQALVGHPAGVPFNIVLNTGQAYSAQALGAAPALHPAGSIISSDKPVAVTMKDDLLTGVYGSCSDPGGDQLIPDALAGTRFIAVKGFLNNPGDRVLVMGLSNGTSISVNGSPVATVNAGQTHAFHFPGAAMAVYIEASAPVHVLQLTGFGCEVGMGILPQLDCTGSNAVSFTRSSNESLFITLLTKDGDQGNFLYNGAPGTITAADFAPVPGTNGEWVFARLQLSLAQSPLGVAISVANTSGLFHMGFINGGATGGCRFGYFSNFGDIDASATATPPQVCVGGQVQLSAASVANATYMWTGPAGFTSTAQNPLLTNLEQAQAGDYIVTVAIPGCGSVSDTVSVSVVPIVAHATADPAVVCAGASTQLTASTVSGATYAWTGPSGFTSALQAPALTGLQPPQGGDYILTVNVPGCTAASDTVNVQVTPAPVGSLSLTACPGQPVQLPDGSTVSEPGAYTVQLTTPAGCDSLVVVTITAPTLTIAASGPPAICAGATAPLQAGAAASYSWEPAADLDDPTSAAPVATPATTTTYTVVATFADGCTATAQVTVQVIAPGVELTLFPAQGLAPLNVAATASATDCDLLNWSAGGVVQGTGVNVLIAFPTSGLHPVEVTCVNSALGCAASATAHVLVFDEFVIHAPNTFTPDGDGINDRFGPVGMSVDPTAYSMVIFDRWGRIVFETTDPATSWDGRASDGTPVQDGIYAYRITARPFYPDGGQRTVELRGHVTLLR
jgi:gliding motility-associated-like protein